MTVPYKNSSLPGFDMLYYHEPDSIVLLLGYDIYLQRNELDIELNLMKYSKFSDYQINTTDRVFVKHNLIVNRSKLLWHCTSYTNF
jgi:hypothetical protein